MLGSFHIVAIRSGGVIIAQQLRFNSNGSGNSKYFSCSRHGGPEGAREAARSLAADLGLAQGEAIPNARAAADRGIRFQWRERSLAPVLNVVSSWRDRTGRERRTGFSVEKHGLVKALDSAIETRTAAGAPQPDRHRLLQELHATYAAGVPGSVRSRTAD